MSLSIVAVSDTHNNHGTLALEKGDCFIHAGDATNRGTTAELNSFLGWMSHLPFEHKIFVPGNHEFSVMRDIVIWRERYPNIDILIHDMKVINDIRIYGCASMWGRGNPVEDIPECDVLVTHNAAFGILDEVPAGQQSAFGEAVESIGDANLGKVIARLQPRFHFHGHVHCNGGLLHMGTTTLHFNLAACDDKNSLVRGCSCMNVT